MTIGIAATAASTLGTVVSGVSQAQGMKYAARVGEKNAALDRAGSRDAMERGQVESQRQYRANAQRLGATRATLAANGIESDFGSASDIQTDTARIGWEDAQTVRENAMRESRGYEIRGWNSSADAVANRANATATMWSTGLSAVSTMLGGASQVAGMKTAPKPRSYAPAPASGGYSGWTGGMQPY